MKTITSLLILLLSVSECRADRVVFAGFDLSATAWRGESNPYDAGWMQVLQTMEGGDHIYGSVINEKGLANGAPPMDVTIRPYSFFTDKRNEYDAAVRAKLENQRQLLNKLLKGAVPSKRTEIIGFLHAAAHVLDGYPAKTEKQVVIWTDGLQEGDEVDLAHIAISDEQITKIIETERRAGRLPKLNGVAVWFVTSPSVESTQFTTSKLLRLEVFWRKYLQSCGAELKAFSPVLVNFGGHMATGSNIPTSQRSKSPPLNKGATMYIWPEEMEQIDLNGRDGLRLKHLFDGTIITGAKGSAKTSTTAAYLHASLLATHCGGVVACPKPTDYKDYMRLIRQWRREQDVILMRPTADWADTPINAINVLEAEQKLFGRGKANIGNVTALLMKVSDLIQRQGGQAASNESFWRSYAEKVIKAGLSVQSILSNRFDLKLLLKFVNTLPNSFAEIDSNELYAVAQVQQAMAKLGDNAPYEFTGLVYDFVMREWPLSPPQGRASGALTVQVMLNTLLSHPLRQMLFETTTFDLDRVLNHGGILLLDMDVQNYAQGGIAGMILKDLVSRACQARPELSSHEPQFVQPVYLLYDEYPEYAIDADEKHARTGRSARLIPIFITQSTTSLKAQFQDKDKAQALLDLAGCRWAHQNGSFDTNEWMAKTIGQIVVQRGGTQDGSNTTYGPQSGFGRNRGQSFTEQPDFDCPPRVFTRLMRGGHENKLKAEAIFWRNGDLFRWNNRRWCPVAMRQDFNPKRDEARVTANQQQKGGERYVREFTTKLLNSASKTRWF